LELVLNLTQKSVFVKKEEGRPSRNGNARGGPVETNKEDVFHRKTSALSREERELSSLILLP